MNSARFDKPSLSSSWIGCALSAAVGATTWRCTAERSQSTHDGEGGLIRRRERGLPDRQIRDQQDVDSIGGGGRSCESVAARGVFEAPFDRASGRVLQEVVIDRGRALLILRQGWSQRDQGESQTQKEREPCSDSSRFEAASTAGN